MRDYAKLGPTFWTGETGKALRRRGSEAVISALYLISSPHSNMLGLYYQPLMYMAHETGLGVEGARKGLQHCIEAGLCSYDEDTEIIFVHEMAAWQIGDELSSGDKRCKGIQKDYDALPNCPFLEQFFERYEKPFNLTHKRSNPLEKKDVCEGAYQAPSMGATKPHRSQEQEQEQENPSGSSGAKAPAAAAAPAVPAIFSNPLPEQPEPEPMPAAKPLSAKDRAWSLGPALLGDTTANRSLVARLIADHGAEVVATVLAEATLHPPDKPKPWVIAACAARANDRQKANGKHHEAPTTRDLLNRDPIADWATRAGFATIFEAETAGCGPGNASKFRDGRRIA